MGSSSKHVVEVEGRFTTTGAKDFVKKTKNISKANRDMETALRSSEKESKRAGLQLEKDARSGEVAIERGRKARKKQEDSITNVEKRQKTFNKIQKEHGLNQAAASKTMQAAGLKVDRVGDVVNVAGKKQKDYNQALRNNIGASRKFQMEQLGVMFGGMALNRAMSNLNATAREWAGMNELMSTAMGIVMLPTTMDLLNFGILPLFDALINLPEGAKKAIGLVALGLEGLGAVMLVGGQLMLGLDSTATLLSKIAGVKPEFIFTSKGLSSLQRKLTPLVGKLKTLGKFAAAGILISVAIKDLGEGQVVAALGDAFALAGILIGGLGGLALMTVGVTLKLLGDEDFLVDVLKVGFKIGKTLNSIIKEAVISGFTMRNFNVDNIEGFGNVARAFGRAIEEIQQEQAGEGIFDFIAYPENMLAAVQEDIDRLEEELKDDIINKKEYLAELIPLVDKQEKILKRWQAAFAKNEEFKTESKEIEKTSLTSSTGAFPTASPLGFNPISFIANLFKDEGNKAVGGRINRTGRYFLHEGEEVINKNQTSGGVAMQVTYNVTVSDKREFEQMLRTNNDKLTADVRRMAKI